MDNWVFAEIVKLRSLSARDLQKSSTGPFCESLLDEILPIMVLPAQGNEEVPGRKISRVCGHPDYRSG